MGAAEKIKEAGTIIGGLGVIGFLGLIFIMMFGSMSGSFGTGGAFADNSTTYTNQTINLNDTGSIPGGITGLVNPTITASSVVMTNATGGEVIASGNYTLTINTFTNATATYGEQDVNVSYIVVHDSQFKIDTENVILNNTGGIKTFFGFSNTFYTIAAIVLLVFMLLGLLAIVMKIMDKQGKKSGYSGY